MNDRLKVEPIYGFEALSIMIVDNTKLFVRDCLVWRIIEGKLYGRAMKLLPSSYVGGWRLIEPHIDAVMTKGWYPYVDK